MKTVGNTNDGKILVEMSKAEHESFVELQVAVEEGTRGTMFMRDIKALRGIDLTEVFGAIKLYVESRFYVNEMKETALRLEEMLKSTTK